MVINQLKVIIVFVSGRKERLKTNQSVSREFFYSYHFLKERIDSVDIIEFNDSYRSVLLGKILVFSDKVLRKLTRLPFFMQEIISKENYIKFKNSTHLILSNDRIACSIIPIMVILKLFNKIPNITFFALGIFNDNSNNFFVKNLKKITLRILISLVDNIIFLGEGEYKFVTNNFPHYSSKLHFLPFCVDNKFWEAECKIESKKNGILFIGNDGKRDYKKLIEIARTFPEINFTFVTTMIAEEDIKEKNIQLIRGHWNHNILGDDDLRLLYKKSKITILPLVESLQPSGQSVALQSMSVGTPVFITETMGFWDFNKFKNLDNIVFAQRNDLEDWKNLIEKYYNDEKFLTKISTNATRTVQEYFDIDVFNNKLAKITGVISD
jgi:glycosyltransferase involved in cell wall biosynthesis